MKTAGLNELATIPFAQGLRAPEIAATRSVYRLASSSRCGRVVVDVKARISGKAAHDEINERLERPSLRVERHLVGQVQGPEGMEGWLAIRIEQRRLLRSTVDLPHCARGVLRPAIHQAPLRRQQFPVLKLHVEDPVRICGRDRYETICPTGKAVKVGLRGYRTIDQRLGEALAEPACQVLVLRIDLVRLVPSDISTRPRFRSSTG